MSDIKPQYEYEAWLLPYKPLDLNEETSEVQKNLSNFETNNAGKEQNVVRDSKNRRILSKEALFEDKSGKIPDDIPGLTNIPNPNGDQIPRRKPGLISIPVATSIPASGSNTAVASSIPVNTNIPGPNTIPGHNSYLGPRFVQPTNGNPSINTSSDPRKKNKEKQRGQKVKLNPLQRKLGKALATPVTTLKAESMMLKMGWSGGALGKTGGGIMEPIAPNLDYATSTKGFGQAPPSPKAKKAPTNPVKAARQPKTIKENKLGKKEKKRMAHQQRSQLNKLLKENVMNYILEFVRNEREIVLVFDKDLHNGQRKTIHRIVEEIRKLGEYGDQSRMDEGFDRLSLLYIAKHNRYVLQTQSEGDPPYRYLCLFKEASKSMYLITHFKLNDKETDFLVKEETVQHRTRRKARKERRTDRWLVRNQRNINTKRSDDREYKIDKDSFGNTERKILDNGEDHDKDEKYSESESDNCGSEDENNSEMEGDKDCESENEINKPDEIMSENDNGVINFNEITKTTEYNKIIDIEEEIMGIVERTTSEACRITKTDEVLDSDVARPEIDKNTLESRDFKTGEPTIENNNESFKSKESEPKIIEQKIDEVIPNDDKAVNISILSSSRKEFMRYNLNMCFSDFLANDLFKEFKFLGEFDVEEFQVLNEFLRDFFLAKKGKSALDEEFMGIWSKAKSKLAFKRDLNGGILIYKAS